MDAKISSVSGGSSGGTTSTVKQTSAGTVDTSGIQHLTGAQILSQYPARWGNGQRTPYQYLVWSGNYTASTLPSGYTNIRESEWTTKNQYTGLMGKLFGGDEANRGYDSEVGTTIVQGVHVYYQDASGSTLIINGNAEGHAGAVRNSVFTIAPLVY